MKVTELVNVIAPEARQDVIGIRALKKLHEQMIGSEESFYTHQGEECFLIIQSIQKSDGNTNPFKDVLKDDVGFSYGSHNNSNWKSRVELKAWIETNQGNIGNFG